MPYIQTSAEDDGLPNAEAGGKIAYTKGLILKDVFACVSLNKSTDFASEDFFILLSIYLCCKCPCICIPIYHFNLSLYTVK